MQYIYIYRFWGVDPASFGWQYGQALVRMCVLLQGSVDWQLASHCGTAVGFVPKLGTLQSGRGT